MRARTNAPLSSLTKLEAERESRLRSQEEKERISVLGQRSETKAYPWVRKDFNEKEQQERREFEMDLQLLQKLLKERSKKPYFRYLASIFFKLASREDIPRKYKITVDLTDKGVVVRVGGTMYQGAFAPCGLPSYDWHACQNLAIKLGNTIAKLEGYVSKTDGGIIIPDEEHLKKYGRNYRQ